MLEQQKDLRGKPHSFRFYSFIYNCFFIQEGSEGNEFTNHYWNHACEFNQATRSRVTLICFTFCDVASLCVFTLDDENVKKVAASRHESRLWTGDAARPVKTKLNFFFEKCLVLGDMLDKLAQLLWFTAARSHEGPGQICKRADKARTRKHKAKPGPYQKSDLKQKPGPKIRLDLKNVLGYLLVYQTSLRYKGHDNADLLVAGRTLSLL